MGVKRAFSLRDICLEREKQVKAGKMRLDGLGLLLPDRSSKGISKSILSDILAMSDEILKNPPVDRAHKKGREYQSIQYLRHCWQSGLNVPMQFEFQLMIVLYKLKHAGRTFRTRGACGGLYRLSIFWRMAVNI